MEKAHLYIVLTRTNTIVSRLIHVFTQDDYTHAALSLDRDLREMYSFARKRTHNPFVGRFKHERLNEGIYKLAKQLPGIVIEVEVLKENYEEARLLVEQFILNRSRYKYNYRGLIYGLLNKPTKTNDRFLCSQFVYYVLYESGVADFRTPANLVRPQDFLNLEGRIVFQGDLKDLDREETTSLEGHSLPIRVRVLNWCKRPFQRVS